MAPSKSARTQFIRRTLLSSRILDVKLLKSLLEGAIFDSFKLSYQRVNRTTKEYFLKGDINGTTALQIKIEKHINNLDYFLSVPGSNLKGKLSQLDLKRIRSLTSDGEIGLNVWDWMRAARQFSCLGFDYNPSVYRKKLFRV